MPDAVSVTGRDGSMQFVNRVTETLFGYAAAELVGKQLEVLLPARFRTAHRAHRNEYFAAPRMRPMGVALQLTGLRKDGTEFPVDISLAPFSFDAKTFAIAAVRDVTERERLEEQARQLAKAEDEIREPHQVRTSASHERSAPPTSTQI